MTERRRSHRPRLLGGWRTLAVAAAGLALAIVIFVGSHSAGPGDASADAAYLRHLRARHAAKLAEVRKWNETVPPMPPGTAPSPAP